MTQRYAHHYSESLRDGVEVLRTLAEDRKNWVRGGVAKNSSTPVDILQTLAKDEDKDVRSNVARNSSMLEELLRNLTEDENIVRIGVAANSSAPGDILQMLAKDEDFRVREGVAWNRNACLEWLTGSSKNSFMNVHI